MSETQADSGSAELEKLVIRFKDLDSRKSAFRPRDMLLRRFERERYSVVGRPGEGSSVDKASGAITLAPEILAELRANGHDVEDIEYPPGSAPSD